MKTCCKCKETKELTEFSKNRTTKDGLQFECKPCKKEYRRAHYLANKDKEYKRKRLYYTDPKNKEKIKQWSSEHKKRHRAYYLHLSNERRAKKIQRTVSWADMNKIKNIYKEAVKLRESGHDVHVDHIVPLQGENVSGLHVEYNLQIISAKENLQKSNKYVDTTEKPCYNI